MRSVRVDEEVSGGEQRRDSVLLIRAVDDSTSYAVPNAVTLHSLTCLQSTE